MRDYMRGLSKPEPLIQEEEEDEPEPEDETIEMVMWCVNHRTYETGVCDDKESL